jgi:hypothetical protein
MHFLAKIQSEEPPKQKTDKAQDREFEETIPIQMQELNKPIQYMWSDSCTQFFFLCGMEVKRMMSVDEYEMYSSE